MTRAAGALRRQRYTLRSGHAPGADQAFEQGAAGRAEVYLPWPSFEANERIQTDFVIDHPTREALALAAEFHPNWLNLKRGARQLHARNCHQVLGLGLDDPAAFVLCWTSDGSLDVASGSPRAGRARRFGSRLLAVFPFSILRARSIGRGSKQ